MAFHSPGARNDYVLAGTGLCRDSSQKNRNGRNLSTALDYGRDTAQTRLAPGTEEIELDTARIEQGILWVQPVHAQKLTGCEQAVPKGFAANLV